MEKDRETIAEKIMTCRDLGSILDCCSILDTIPDFISIHDTSYRIIFTNKALRKFLSENSVGKLCFKVFHGTETPPPYCPLKKTLEKAAVSRRIFFEEQLQRQLMVTTSPIRDRDGKIIAAMHITRDVTHLQLMEDRFEQQKVVSDFILEKSPLGIAFVKDRTIVKTNEAFEKISGFSRQEICGRNTSMFYPDQKAYETIGKKVYSYLERHQVWSSEEMMRRKDGSTLPVRISVRRIADLDDDAGDAYIWMVEDLSGQKQLEEAQRQIDERMQRAQRLEALGVLASGIAHDFNNILTPIMGYTELAQCFASDPRLSQYLKTISKATSQAKELIENLLKFSRGEAGEPSLIDISRLIKEHVKLLKGVVPSSVVIKTEIHDIPRPVICDPAQLNEILMNLCTNAIHAMDERGELTIGCISVNADKVLMSKWPEAQNGRYAKFWVSDTGCGMDHRTLEKIFDPYFTTKGPEKGTGLGLAMVFNAVKANRGFIEVDSTPGDGTTFTVYLPLSEDEAPGYEQGKDVCKNIESLSGAFILLVDDEESVLMLAREFMELAGAKVVSRSSPLEALEFIKGLKGSDTIPDILVTDLTMPQLTGEQLALEARKLIPGLPVVIITGFGMRHKEVAADFPVVNKPFKMGELIRVIKQTLEKDKGRDKK